MTENNGERVPAQSASAQQWAALRRAVLPWMRGMAVLPRNVLMLVAHASLLPYARQAWAMEWDTKIAAELPTLPRFAIHTLHSFAQSLSPFVASGEDLRFSATQDLLSARALIRQARLVGAPQHLAERLLQAAWEVAPAAARCAPDQRSAWAQTWRARLNHLPTGAGADTEQALAQLALAWAASSSYASDILHQAQSWAGYDAVVLVSHAQSDALAAQLAQQHGLPCLTFQAQSDSGDSQSSERADVGVTVHESTDLLSQAEQAVVCLLRHLEPTPPTPPVAPLALVVLEPALAPHIVTLLQLRGVRVEGDAVVAPTHSAAQTALMTCWRAVQAKASTEAVLSWVAQCPLFSNPARRAITQWARATGLARWPELARAGSQISNPHAAQTLRQIEALRAQLPPRKAPLVDWLAGLGQVLQQSQLRERLASDSAGRTLLSALLTEGTSAAAQQTVLDANEFEHWLQTLLAQPSDADRDSDQTADVICVPLHQLWGRPWRAVVVAGCSQYALPPRLSLSTVWSTKQRAALGLPSLDAQRAAQAQVWQECLNAAPQVYLLWSAFDARREPQHASAWVLQLLLDKQAQTQADPRPQRTVPIQMPTPKPAPVARALLPLGPVSASAYEDLRACPYRFFARHLLRLRAPQALDELRNARDYGVWLHSVLALFHQRCTADLHLLEPAQQSQRLDQAAAAINAQALWQASDFLPYMAAWPRVRDAYLQWLQSHLASGARFNQAEATLRREYAGQVLHGRVDRLDQMPDGSQLLLDYKTEYPERSRQRLALGPEDTQLAFYAALLGDASVRAAYLNVGEHGTALYEPDDVATLAEQLLAGFSQDQQALAQGAALPALGQGEACEHCEARGLCRRDFWATKL